MIDFPSRIKHESGEIIKVKELYSPPDLHLVLAKKLTLGLAINQVTLYNIDTNLSKISDEARAMNF